VRPYLKKTHHTHKKPKQKTKKNPAGGVAQGVGPEFKPQYRKKTRNLRLCHKEE
jgi:hypothetical protein